MTLPVLTFDQIKKLYQAGETHQAYSALEKYLVSNNQDSKAFKLLQSIKKDLLKKNIEKINQAIQRFDYLEQQQKYQELLTAYLEIQKFAPDYIPLQNKIQKIYQIILKDQNNTQNQEFQKIQQLVETKLANQEFTETITFLEQTINQDSNNILLRKLLIETKRQIIDHKLLTNKSNFNTQSIPKIYDFIKTLYNFEPTYPKIQKLLISYHSKLKLYYQNQKLVFEKDAVRQIKVLFNQQEYQKCLQACQELLRTTFYNQTALKYRKKAQSAIIGQNFREAYAKIFP